MSTTPDLLKKETKSAKPSTPVAKATPAYNHAPSVAPASPTGNGTTAAAAAAMNMWADAKGESGGAIKDLAHNLLTAPPDSVAANPSGSNFAASPTNHQQVVNEKVNELIKKTTDGMIHNNDSARKNVGDLANILRDKNLSESDKSAVLVQLIRTNPYLATSLLSEVGTPGQRNVMMFPVDVGKDDMQLVSHYLGNAYVNDPKKKLEYGQMNVADLQKLIDPKLNQHYDQTGALGANAGQAPWGIATLLQHSKNKDMQKDGALTMLHIAKTNKGGSPGDLVSDMHRDIQNDRLCQASAITASGSPEASAALLHQVSQEPGGMDAFMKKASRASDQHLPSMGGKPTLDKSPIGELMTKVGQIDGSKDLELQTLKDQAFDTALNHIDNDPMARAGLAKYFQSNMDHVSRRLTAFGPGLVEREKELTHFMQDVMWQNDGFDGQKQLRGDFAQYLASRVQGLKKMPGDQNGRDKSKREAHDFGALLGSTEVGFRRELDGLHDDNAKNKDMADFIFSIVSAPANLIPFDIPIPGIGSTKGLALDQIKKALEASSQQKLPSAKETTLPLYNVGLNINPNLATDMQSARGEVFDNYGMQYLK